MQNQSSLGDFVIVIRRVLVGKMAMKFLLMMKKESKKNRTTGSPSVKYLKCNDAQFGLLGPLGINAPLFDDE